MSTASAFWLVPPPETGARVAPLAAVRRLLPTFPSPPLRVSRVGQLDAALLDHELEGILGGPFWKALEGLRVRRASLELCSLTMARNRGDARGSRR